jgi:hypothetical protein
MMTAFEIKLNLPDGLVQEAETNGLLTPQSIEILLREEIRRRRVSQLFTSADRLADQNSSELVSAEEIETEIAAARKQRTR